MRRTRLRISDTRLGLDVEIDARPGRSVIAALVGWVALWLIGEWTILARMAAYQQPGSDPFLVVLLAFWTLGGLSGARGAFARLKTRELIRLDAGTLHYRREYRWFRRSLRFERGEISNVRALTASELDPLKNPTANFWNLNAGGILFEYRGATWRIASQLSRSDSEVLAARIASTLDMAERGTVD